MKKLLGCLGMIVGSIVLLAVVIGIYAWQEQRREKHQAEAASTANVFSHFTGAKAPPANALDDSKARYRKGHLLLVNDDGGMVDEMFYTLPPELRATGATDVGTEVWLHWDSHVMGKYENGGTAFKTNCDAVVYDVARNAIVAREHFEGEDPPLVLTNPRGSKEGWEKLPTDKVMKFLQELPTR